jgi:hypothetical protein
MPRSDRHRTRPPRAFRPDLGGGRLDTLALPGPLWLQWWTLPQSYISVQDSAGNVTYPQGGAQLLAQLQQIQASGNTVSVLFVKGHGGSGDSGPSVNDGVIQLSDGDPNDTLSSVPAAGFIGIAGTPVNGLLASITNAQTSIYLTGCETDTLACGLSAQLGNGATVYGMSGSPVGIPWTSWTVGQPLIPYIDGWLGGPPASGN